MNERTDLPPQRPMPEALRDQLWSEIEPQLDTPPTHGRFRTMRAPLAVAASVIVLALGIVIALPLLRGQNLEVATSGLDPLVRECVLAEPGLPDPSGWRPGARLDLDAQHGFLVIRTDKLAAACVIENGHGTGVIGGADVVAHYDKLTANRPFDYLTSMNYPNESIHFGIAAGNVAALSLIGPNNSTSPGVVRDGTFAVRTKFGENSDQPNTNYVQATLDNQRVVTAPLRN